MQGIGQQHGGTCKRVHAHHHITTIAMLSMATMQHAASSAPLLTRHHQAPPVVPGHHLALHVQRAARAKVGLSQAARGRAGRGTGQNGEFAVQVCQ